MSSPLAERGTPPLKGAEPDSEEEGQPRQSPSSGKCSSYIAGSGLRSRKRLVLVRSSGSDAFSLLSHCASAQSGCSEETGFHIRLRCIRCSRRCLLPLDNGVAPSQSGKVSPFLDSLCSGAPASDRGSRWRRPTSRSEAATSCSIGRFPRPRHGCFRNRPSHRRIGRFGQPDRSGSVARTAACCL